MSFEDSDIYQAILDGDLAALGCSVNDQDVNLRDSSGKSYLHICIELGQQDLVEYLAQKVFLGFRDDNGYTPLDLAVRYRMTEVERQLIRCVASMQDSDDTQGLHQLFVAGWRAWPPLERHKHQAPLSPGYQCQLEILQLQKHVNHIHWAVQHGELEELQEALSHDNSLVIVADHTGLPPLQKAIIFEWLSLVQYMSRTFPHAVNHPDHMGRTALHYAAAYHEYQDNILYKQLLKDGANQCQADLVGLTPVDIVCDARLLSIDRIRENVHHRLSRPPKDYTCEISYMESQNLPSGNTATTIVANNIKRWKMIAYLASFAKTSQRKITRSKPFEETKLYEAVITNDIRHTRHALSEGEDDIHQRSLEGWSYLHLAVVHHASPALVSLLLMELSPAEWDCEGQSPLDLCLKQGNVALAKVFVHVVIGLILNDDLDAVQGLMQDGWHYWPGEDYVTTVLQPWITQHMMHFLLSVHHFMDSVREVHQAAILHQDLDASLSPLLDTEVAISCLNCMGLSLPHVCVIFYNIHLLSHLLRLFPFIANLKDSVGRTPLHYAAGLDDNDYMFSFLRDAKARDDEEDLWGMRPVDYRSDKHRIVSPRIQEIIRNRLYNPHSLVTPWPSCLLY